jgi:hypothetical protein
VSVENSCVRAGRGWRADPPHFTICMHAWSEGKSVVCMREFSLELFFSKAFIGVVFLLKRVKLLDHSF